MSQADESGLDAFGLIGVCPSLGLAEFVFEGIVSLLDVPSAFIDPCEQTWTDGHFVGDKLVGLAALRVLVNNASERSRRALARDPDVLSHSRINWIIAIPIRARLLGQSHVRFDPGDEVNAILIFPLAPLFDINARGVPSVEHLAALFRALAQRMSS